MSHIRWGFVLTLIGFLMVTSVLIFSQIRISAITLTNQSQIKLNTSKIDSTKQIVNELKYNDSLFKIVVQKAVVRDSLLFIILENQSKILKEINNNQILLKHDR